MLSQNTPTYNFKASRHHNNESVTCEVTNGDFVVYNQSIVSVNYEPEFYYGTKGSSVTKNVKHGDNVLFNCNSHENDKGSVRWFFSVDGKTNRTELDEKSKLFNVKNMKKSLAGTYECIVENSVGDSSKTFRLRHKAQGNYFW